MARALGIASAVVLATLAIVAQSARTTLDIYLIDVEGGQSYIAPLLPPARAGGPFDASDAPRRRF